MFRFRHAERLVVAGDTVSWGETMAVGWCMGGWKTLINPDLSRATHGKTAAVGSQNATSD